MPGPGLPGGKNIFLTIKPLRPFFKSEELAKVTLPGRNRMILSFQHYDTGYHRFNGILERGTVKLFFSVMLDRIIGSYQGRLLLGL
jgi:hypothetical protein